MDAGVLRLAIIIGSVREGRFGPTVARWFVREAEAFGRFSIDVIDLAEADLPVVLTDEPPAEVAAVTPRLAAADAFVMVTPEYNRGYPASLKSLIDWHFEEWQAKPVGFVSYGGRAGGMRSVEQLIPVLGELHAVTIREAVSFHDAWDQFDDSGQLRDSDAAHGAAKAMLDQLSWWALALSEARAKRPYNA
ncbi:NAD(P)H-dependent oxidoreductase [Haloechinothrix sp. LS1_15]|uniref:NADPH-dependent FMN reductase n=1 Tax=Haloechinothrix sp. LS1_15 TaxID=2652248 RepID=UPI002946DDDC|nr:NAD(P)H-dependent oxidoreductase [Haloechinothrix sp. LS1_15]MDV6011624.1 NAD(P)H-dependent oxidoreductase [Haloechinothrix sp. LS1_15]